MFNLSEKEEMNTWSFINVHLVCLSLASFESKLFYSHGQRSIIKQQIFHKMIKEVKSTTFSFKIKGSWGRGAGVGGEGREGAFLKFHKFID